MHPAWAARSDLPRPLGPQTAPPPQSGLGHLGPQVGARLSSPRLRLLLHTSSPPQVPSSQSPQQPLGGPEASVPTPHPPPPVPAPGSAHALLPPARQPAQRPASLPVRPAGEEARRGGKRSRGGGGRGTQRRGGSERGDVEGGTEPGQRWTGNARTRQSAARSRRRERRGEARVISGRPCTECPLPQRSSHLAKEITLAGPRSPDSS